MAVSHPGKWEIVLNQSQCLLNTGETAVHACLLGNHSTQVWKILYFFAGQGSGPYKSGIWNPANNAITEQTIPNWNKHYIYTSAISKCGYENLHVIR